MTGKILSTFKIILIYLKNPTLAVSNRTDWVGESLGISYLAACCEEAGMPAIIIDQHNDIDITLDELFQQIITENPQLVGFSITHLTIANALDLAKKLKNTQKGMHICLGGHHATLSAARIMETETAVDSIVRGEGEITFIKMAQALKNGESLRDIKGIYYRDPSGQVMMNPERYLIEDIDTLPFPKRYILEKSTTEGKKPIGTRISSSRGCYWNCRFCSTPPFYRVQIGHHWRPRSAKSVVDEIQMLYENYGCEDFSFIDDNAVIPTAKSKERLQEIANEILDRGLKVHLFMMFSALTFNNTDSVLLTSLRKAGLNRILLGIEAGNRNTLQLYRKPTKPLNNITAVDFLSTFGFGLLCSTITFHPYTTVEELINNGEFIKTLMDKTNVSMFAPYCTQLEIYPGTDLFEMVLIDKLLTTNKPYIEACAYRFQLSVIGNILNGLRLARSQMIETDWLVWDTRLAELELELLKDEFNDNNRSEVELASSNAESTIRSINNLTFDYFIRTIETATQKSRKTDQGIILQYFLSELSKKYNQLKTHFTQCQRFVSEASAFALKYHGKS